LSIRSSRSGFTADPALPGACYGKPRLKMVEREAFPGYGPRLSGREYDGKIAELYQSLAGNAATGSSDIEAEIETGEFNLLIDHKLGIDFPADKRAALLDAKRRIGRNRLKLVAAYLGASLRKRGFANAMQVLLEQMCAEFAKILTEEELIALLDRKPGETPILPLDPGKL